VKNLVKMVVSGVFLAVVVVGCGTVEKTSTSTQGFGECKVGRENWKQCKDGKVQWCHVLDKSDAHFHWSHECDLQGLSCVNIDNKGKAACVDETKSCTAADEKCDNNTAYFCVNGKLGQEPCGTAKVCHHEKGKAPHCVKKSVECGGHGHIHGDSCHCDKGYKQDPGDKKNCIAEVGFPQQSCVLFGKTATKKTLVEDFSKFKDAHAEHDTVYEVTLPDNKPAYVHFPVKATGNYVIFLSHTDVFDSFVHRNRKEVSSSGGKPNGKCADTIKDHWHGKLTLDGDKDVEKVPYIVRFKAVTGGKTIQFMLRHKPE
jgi:uncharacterized protein YceK